MIHLMDDQFKLELTPKARVEIQSGVASLTRVNWVNSWVFFFIIIIFFQVWAFLLVFNPVASSAQVGIYLEWCYIP